MIQDNYEKCANALKMTTEISNVVISNIKKMQD